MNKSIKTNFSRMMKIFLALTLIITQIPFVNVFAYDDSVDLSVSPTSGKSGDSIYVFVSNMPYNEEGYVYFDINNDNHCQSGEPTYDVSADYYGEATASLTVPSVCAGTYYIRYGTYSSNDLTYYKADFTVENSASMSLSPTSGIVGSSVTVSISDLPSSDVGYIYFDKNNSGTFDTGDIYWDEVADEYGKINETIKIPSASAGTYNIKYVSSENSSITLTTAFTVKSSGEIELSTCNGTAGSSVTVNLTNLPSYDYGYIYFDEDNDGSKDTGEDSLAVYANYSGEVSKDITIPDVSAGTYSIRYISSDTVGLSLGSTFTVNASPKMSLSPASGAAGSSVTVSISNLPSSDYGYVYFDKNNNGKYDTGEDNYKVYANSLGTISKTINIPNVTSGVYTIKYLSAKNIGLIVSNSFTVKKVSVTGISLDKKTLTFNEGDSPVTLKATVSPSSASNKNVTWESSDEEVATVDCSGTVTPVGAGTAVITATTEDGYKSASCSVTVGSGDIAVTKISLDKSALKLTVGGSTATLKATVAPSDATDKTICFTSSDDSVATVDCSGTVTPVAAGSAVITAASVDGTVSASCSVTVTEKIVDKNDYTLNELINDEDSFNDLLSKYSLDELKVVIPPNNIESIKITQNDQMKLSSFEVNVNSKTVDSVVISVNNKDYKLDYKGSEVTVNAYKGTNLVDSSVQRLRTLEYTSTLPEKTEYTFDELIGDLELFNQVLGSYTLDQIHVVAPQSYISDVQIKYNSLATAIIAVVKNGADKVEFETQINGQTTTTTMTNKGNGRFEKSVSGLEIGDEVKIKVYKDNVLVDQIVKKVTE